MTIAKTFRHALLVALFAGAAAQAQVPVVPAADQEALLASADPKLAANKKLVWDFWREVLEAGHMEQADKLMAESYIQHNPNVPTGRAAFVAFFTQHVKPRAVQPRIEAPLVSIVAEGYIQHNPNVPTGRAAFVAFFTQHVKPRPVQPRIAAPLVSIVAEGDLVILSFVQPTADPKDATKKSTTTWFDMFRIENARIAEHWDCAPRQ